MNKVVLVFFSILVLSAPVSIQEEKVEPKKHEVKEVVKKEIKPAPVVKPKKVDNRFNAVIRILVNGYTNCSAFVISDSMAMTAAHCVDDFNPLSHALADKDKKHFQAFAIYKASAHLDQAILLGDFTRYKKLPLKKITNGIEGNKGPFKTCGYPYGGKLICFDWEFKTTRYFNLSGKGFLYGGMSGGPLIDWSTGQVLGINVSVSAEDYSNISPLVNTLEYFGLRSEE